MNRWIERLDTASVRRDQLASSSQSPMFRTMHLNPQKQRSMLPSRRQDFPECAGQYLSDLIDSPGNGPKGLLTHIMATKRTMSRAIPLFDERIDVPAKSYGKFCTVDIKDA